MTRRDFIKGLLILLPVAAMAPGGGTPPRRRPRVLPPVDNNRNPGKGARHPSQPGYQPEQTPPSFAPLKPHR